MENARVGGEDMDKSEKVVFRISIREEKVEEVKRLIEETEKELGESSESEVEVKGSIKAFPGLTEILVTLGKVFVVALIDKYQEPVVDWLKEKLKLDEDENEAAEESS